MGVIERIKSEYAYLSGAIRTLARVTPIAKNKNHTICDLVDELAEKYDKRVALISDYETFSFRQYNERANQYARWAIENGIRKGDCVALMMPNRPEYLAIWLGVARAGGVTALLNTNLNGAALAHCINIVKPKHIIVAAGLVAHVQSARSALDEELHYWIDGADHEGYQRLNEDVDRHLVGPLHSSEHPVVTTEDRCLYIYTSGTTGLPKAANINHYRVQGIMAAFSAATNATQTDRIYVCLPMYHSVGGVLAIGTTITVGGSVVIAERFSAARFWDDIVDHHCTIFQYIGELCRYLVNSPPHPKEQKHSLKFCTGNGLRPDIWMDFKTRFAIPKIFEWYAATEGNAVLFNFDGRPGSIGRIPKWMERRFVIRVVKFDVQSQDVVRDENGFCILADMNEVGEMIAEILDDPTKPSQRFEGYVDLRATEEKIMRNVFKAEDTWFRTGDLVKVDALGYFFFIDRTGDTFRWKGENVATSEVAETLTSCQGIMEANVYGVIVGQYDGRAGMAAIVVDDSFDLVSFKVHIVERLPRYARPLFLRLSNQLDKTGTFKMRKVDLMKDGFNPDIIPDDLYFNHPVERRYVPLDRALYDQIQQSEFHI